MTTNKIENLLEKMKSDPVFRDRVLSIKNVDDRMAFLNREGFECKKEDIQLYLEHYKNEEGNQIILATEKGGCHGIYYGFCF